MALWGGQNGARSLALWIHFFFLAGGTTPNHLYSSGYGGSCASNSPNLSCRVDPISWLGRYAKVGRRSETPWALVKSKAPTVGESDKWCLTLLDQPLQQGPLRPLGSARLFSPVSGRIRRLRSLTLRLEAKRRSLHHWIILDHTGSLDAGWFWQTLEEAYIVHQPGNLGPAGATKQINVGSCVRYKAFLDGTGIWPRIYNLMIVHTNSHNPY